MNRVALTAAFILTPFISLYWAAVAFVAGWVGGWQMVMDEWGNE